MYIVSKYPDTHVHVCTCMLCMYGMYVVYVVYVHVCYACMHVNGSV